ncbi:uncharacterized protein LOC143916729 isoform X2 [Arctopsyche grandis]|uniref:uncharacterized protein LOC143916729 isoform X2 n=1 Tax=Arctopsyche grandis TaxID=121162 RepID=UPI00406D8D60
MGRKIPGKKHRGVKDPYKQRAERLAALKSKVNKTPVHPDEQPIPKSLVRLMSWKTKNLPKKLKDTVDPKSSKSVKRNIRTKVVGRTEKNVSNPLKKLQKLDGESKKSFNARINDALKTLKKDTTFDDIINDIPKDRKRKSTDTETFPRRKKRKVDKNEVKLSKSQKRTQREKVKKEEIKENKAFDELFLIQRDNIKFGEVVHEPPSLKIKPRKAEVIDGAPRPARKDLLLNKYFNNVDTQPMSKNVTRDISLQNLKKQGVDLKGKRRDLPDNVRRKLEQSQREAVEAYKLLKTNQHKNK